MKIFFKLFLFLLSIVIIGCNHQRNFRIGVSQCSDDDWRAKMNAEIYREMMFHPEAEVLILSADGDNDKQISQIQFFIDENFDIIIAAPNEADALTPIIEKAYDKGIPVMLFDRKINGDSYTTYQGVDNVLLGKAAAMSAVDLLEKKGKIVQIHGLPRSTPAIERNLGFLEGISEYPDVKIVDSVAGNWTYEEAFPLIDSIFRHNTDIQLVFAHNDRMALAASNAAKKHSLNPFIIGIDGSPELGMKAVSEGDIDATFLYPTGGEKLIQTAISILNGEAYDTLVELPVARAINRSNAEILLAQNEELKQETEKLENLKTQLDDYWVKHNAQGSILWFVIIILILSFIVIFAGLRTFWIHKRHQEILTRKNIQLEKQKDELIDLNSQLNEATQSKLMFFTNVSHDLRTPLTLISEPIEQLNDAENLTPQQHSFVKVAKKNIHILHRLIDQILDFRKFESNKIKLNLVETDLGMLLTEWTDSFRSMAHKRHIEFNYIHLGDRNGHLAIDPEKIERVFFNILSNAFKYTPDNGVITVSFELSTENAVISVKDSGEGISQENLKNIFDHFFQVERIRPKGSGIGLFLAKSFVELHGGKITVESRLGEGTEFKISLPVRHINEHTEELHSGFNEKDVDEELQSLGDQEFIFDKDKPLILLIDDNDDIRNLISEIFKDEFNVVTSDNGKTGVRLATKYVPDLIICDVMMPVMDGFECCRIIKEELSTSHIPVLMLTACSMDEQRVQGFENGADGYVSKPFNSDVLRSQIKSMIVNRKRIRGAELSTVSAAVPAERLRNNIGPIDNDFYKKFLDVVNQNISDPELSVDSLASKMGLARSQFYRKIKALTNFSPVELLRQFRLKYARELLTTTDKSISEIAYEAGFSSAAYFTKCYREEFNETPSQLRERLH